jgi:zinc transport system ATP-binding protein
MDHSILEAQDLWFAYNAQIVLENVNLQIYKGDFTAMIGPNGGGKTTLLKIMLGLLSPQKGVVRVLGRVPGEVSHRIGYVPQDIHINREFPMTALDVVLMGRLKRGRGWSRYSKNDRKAAYDALAAVSMEGYRDRRIGELSGGERQRIFIARALVTNPDILLLDEPTASIDALGQTQIYDLLKTLNKEITILVVSHDLFIISSYVKSILCVNRRAYYHPHAELNNGMFEIMNSQIKAAVCPIELVAHGDVPHRVLRQHRDR